MIRMKFSAWLDDAHKASGAPPSEWISEFSEADLLEAARLKRQSESPEDCTNDAGVLAALSWLAGHANPDCPHNEEVVSETAP